MKKETPWWHDPLLSFVKMATWVSIPILIGLFLGDWIDTKLGTSPWIESSLTVILFLFSIHHLLKDGKKYEEELDKQDHNN